METFNLSPFYVGQRVVALKDHSQGMYKKGDRFIIASIYKATCCDIWLVEIGILSVHNHWKCVICKTGGQKRRSDQAVFNSGSFAPIQENFQSISLEKILEKETELISSN